MIRWLTIAIVVLTGTTISWADIIGVQTNYVLGTKFDTEFLDLDFDENGTVDFQLYAGGFASTAGIQQAGENRYLIHPSPPPNIGGAVAGLSAGFDIGLYLESNSSEDWFKHDGWATLIQILYPTITGEFYQNRAFIGFEFESEDGVHYGWLEVEGATSSFENHLIGESSLIIHGFAYESTPGVSIVAGAVPEPASIFLFMIGAWGTWLLRKNR